MHALSSKKYIAAKLLLHRGANPAIKDTFGKCAYDILISADDGGDRELEELLSKHFCTTLIDDPTSVYADADDQWRRSLVGAINRRHAPFGKSAAYRPAAALVDEHQAQKGMKVRLRHTATECCAHRV
jgi:hypothetical protein